MKSISNIEDIEHRLMVYRQRLSDAIDDQDPERIQFLCAEINDMEAELAVDDLLDRAFPQAWEFVTPDWYMVCKLFRETKVVDMDRRWSWHEFDFVYWVKFIPTAN